MARYNEERRKVMDEEKAEVRETGERTEEEAKLDRVEEKFEWWDVWVEGVRVVVKEVCRMEMNEDKERLRKGLREAIREIRGVWWAETCMTNAPMTLIIGPEALERERERELDREGEKR